MTQFFISRLFSFLFCRNKTCTRYYFNRWWSFKFYWRWVGNWCVSGSGCEWNSVNMIEPRLNFKPLVNAKMMFFTISSCFINAAVTTDFDIFLIWSEMSNVLWTSLSESFLINLHGLPKKTDYNKKLIVNDVLSISTKLDIIGNTALKLVQQLLWYRM